jgi:Inner membrane protein YgaP-like, transmembrane domain
MKKNIGSIDRVIRIIIGLVFIAYALRLGFDNTGWNWVGWFGILPLLTAIVGICPAYSIFGLSTCKR